MLGWRKHGLAQEDVQAAAPYISLRQRMRRTLDRANSGADVSKHTPNAPFSGVAVAARRAGLSR